MKLLTEIPPIAKKGEFVAMDVETFGQKDGKVHRPTGTFACLSIALERDPDTRYQIYDHHDIKKVLSASKAGTWVFHNATYDLRQLRRFATIEPRFIWDIMLVDQSLYGGYYTYFNLKDMSRRWLDIIVNKETREFFSTMTEMTKDMKIYAADDATHTVQIAMKQRDEFEDTSRLDVYRKIDEPMIWPVLDMPGVRIDVGAWTAAVQGFEQKAAELQDSLGFNVNSPMQVLKALGKAGLHLRSTGADVLKEYTNYDLVARILEARMYRKAASTYGIAWLEENVESDGMVYPSWHITGANTGRMSSSNPNGQNIPARKLPIYRTFFIPTPGHVMTIEDVTQQEPCILAYESKDPVLLAAIERGEDLHQAIADAIKQPRSIGKAINLGIGYGLTASGLSSRVGLSEEEAERIITHYFNRFRGVFSWISSTRNFANQHGYVQTASKRRVHVNVYDSQWQNNAINSPIQGGAADFTKVWVRQFWEGCREEKVPYSLCLIVHDEQVKDPHKDALRETNEVSSEAFRRTAETLYKGVPFRFEREVGRSWAAKSSKEEAYNDEEETSEPI
jgi:DNA polymerase-1